MSNKLVMRIAALLCLLAGFAIGMNIFGLKDRSYSVKEGDSFYSQPSVTAQPAAGFAKGEELDVTDKLELAAPTAVKVLQTKIVEDKNRINISCVRAMFISWWNHAWIRRIPPALLRYRR